MIGRAASRLLFLLGVQGLAAVALADHVPPNAAVWLERDWVGVVGIAVAIRPASPDHGSLQQRKPA